MPPRTTITRTACGVVSVLAERTNGKRTIPLGKAPAVAIDNQRVMRVLRDRQVEQRLQQPVDVGGLEQVVAAG